MNAVPAVRDVIADDGVHGYEVEINTVSGMRDAIVFDVVSFRIEQEQPVAAVIHAALDAVSPSVIHPAWVNEGIAEWFEYRTAGVRTMPVRGHEILAQLAAQNALLPLETTLAPEGDDASRWAGVRAAVHT